MWRAVVALTGEPGLIENSSGVDVVDVTHPVSLALHLRDSDVPVVVASHPAHAHAARVACTMLVGDRPDLPVAHVTFAQAPLAAVIALAVAGEIARDGGHAVNVWRDVSRATWSGALVTKASRLAAPNPSLPQHLRSLLPGSHHLARLHPEPAVIGRKRIPDALAPVGRGVVQAISTHTPADSALLGTVLTTVAPTAVHHVPLPSGWQGVLVGDDDIQIALLPADIHPFIRPRGTPCRSCGLSTGDPVCPFCRLIATSRGAAPTAAAHQDPATDLVSSAPQHHPGRTP